VIRYTDFAAAPARFRAGLPDAREGPDLGGGTGEYQPTVQYQPRPASVTVRRLTQPVRPGTPDW